MRRTFRRWLSVFTAIAFVVAVLISFVAQSNMAALSADNLIQQRIVDMRLRVDNYIDRSAQARSVIDSSALVAAQAAKRCISSDPTILDDTERMQALMNDLDIDELCVTDENGIITHSVPAENIGWDMASSEQSAPFMGAISYPYFKYVQSFQEKGLGGNMVKYAGVARGDQNGLVQIGMYKTTIDKTLTIVDSTSIASGVTIGENGMVLVSEGDAIISASNADAVGKSVADYSLNTADLTKSTSSSIVNMNGQEYRVRAESYKNYTVIVALPTSEVYVSRNNSLLGISLLIGFLFCLQFFLVSKLVQKLVIDGIFTVNRSLNKIAHGNLNEVVDVRTSPEFQTLSNGINTTVDSLKDHIAAEASRIDADLALAKAIQLGNLQTVFPAFPDHHEFDLYAHMTPAREVGGDFYDMFMRNDNHLTCVIADVSGKGIPAAMFMMESKSYINSLAMGCDTLAEVFNRANNKLCDNNAAGLFVTAFIMDINLKTGDFEFVNAGHNPPIIMHADGTCEYLACKPGFVLGGLEGISYKSGTGTLLPHERFVGYTDGVTEALNESNELYGENRLVSFLTNKNEVDVKLLVEQLEAELLRYRGEAEQADDITILALDFLGETTVKDINIAAAPNTAGAPAQNNIRGQRGKTSDADDEAVINRIKVDATTDSWNTVSDFLQNMLATNDCPNKTVMQFTLAAEEVFVNIASYAYDQAARDNGTDKAIVICEVNQEEQFASITFIDQGVAYNPLEHADPDVSAPAAERDIGGLGIFMVKKTMDEVAYAREGNSNLLFMKKGWSQ